MNKQLYNWQDFDRDTLKLKTRITEDSSILFNKIYGIPRGGLVLAVKLSHLLDTPLLTDFNQIDSRTLIVDDVADKGDTLLKVGSKLRKKRIRCKVVTVFYKPHSKVLPDMYIRKTKDWIVFPWETLTSSKYDNITI